MGEGCGRHAHDTVPIEVTPANVLIQLATMQVIVSSLRGTTAKSEITPVKTSTEMFVIPAKPKPYYVCLVPIILSC